ncbi:MAG: peptide ABC transporter substrate-binding protein [Eubacterium sp.]|nr:peptide ABC transporter substrate-binding protein [Eubacterium sp.]
MKQAFFEFGKKSLAILLSVIMLMGCGVTEIYNKKSLSIAIIGRPMTLDAAKVEDVFSMTCLSPMKSTLFRLNEKNEPEAYLADYVEVSDDGCIYTIHLKKGLHYSNGDLVDAADYVFGIRRMADPVTASPAVRMIQDCCRIKNVNEVFRGEMPVDSLGVVRIDAETFVVILEEPCPYFLLLLCSDNFSPCKEEFFNSCYTTYGSSPETVLYAGPYMVDRYEPLGTEMHFVKNPYFFDPDETQPDELTIRTVTDVQQAMMSYQTGLVDITQTKDHFVQLAKGDASLKQNLSGNVGFFNGNWRTSDFWKNKNMRLALMNSVDREAFVKNVKYDTACSLTRLIPEGLAPEPDGTDFGTPKDRYKDICSYDPEKAKQYYEKGKKELGKETFKLKMIVSQTNKEVAVAVAAGWEKTLPGLTIDVQIMPLAQWLREIYGDFYDLDFTNYSADIPDPYCFFQFFDAGNPINAEGYDNETVQSFYNMSKYETDPEIRSALLHETEDAIMEDAALIPIYASGGSWLIKDEIRGVNLGVSGMMPDLSGIRKG